MRRWAFALMSGLLFIADAAAQPPVRLTGLDVYVHKVMKQWQVPGLAIAVVKDGKVVLARGYGVRQLGKPEKVDADTLFDIGSNTKAFTAAALGTLVAEKKLTWDAPVAEYVKPFRLSDPYITQSITLRDLLTHYSGYCDPSLMWYTSNDSDVFERLQYQKPEYGFRAHFCYNNITYLAASKFIPAITGESWNHYVADRLFKPLQMTRTVTTSAEVSAANDVAMPHALIDNKVTVIKRYWSHNMDIAAAVGGINSSANDMSHWLLALLDDGRYDGKSVLDPAIIKAMETPQVIVQADSEVGRTVRAWTPGSHFYTYGLGLFVQDDGGHMMVWHAGDIDGMASALAMIPDAHLGVVVMSNMNQSDARFSIMLHILQQYLGMPQHDMNDALYTQAQKSIRLEQAQEKKLAATRKPGSAPLPLSAYAGPYDDKFYGPATVILEGGHLVVRLGNPDFTGDLVHWHDNTFRVTWRDRLYGQNYLTFELDAYGKPHDLVVAGMPLHYERVAVQHAPQQ